MNTGEAAFVFFVLIFTSLGWWTQFLQQVAELSFFSGAAINRNLSIIIKKAARIYFHKVDLLQISMRSQAFHPMLTTLSACRGDQITVFDS